MQPKGHYIQMLDAWADHEHSPRAYSLQRSGDRLFLRTFAVDGGPVDLGTRQIDLAEARYYRAAYTAFAAIHGDWIDAQEQARLAALGNPEDRPGYRVKFYTLGGFIFLRMVTEHGQVICDTALDGPTASYREKYPAAWSELVQRLGHDPADPLPVREPTPFGSETAEELRHLKPRGGGLSMQDEIRRNLALDEQRRAAAAERERRVDALNRMR